MSSKLETLYRLQQLDHVLLDKVREVERFEKALAERRAQMDTVQKRIDDLAARRKVAITERALAERRVEEQGDMLRDRRQRGGRIRTEKELRANQDELSNIQGEMSDVETRLLELMQAIEEVEGKLAAEKSAFAELETDDHRHVAEETERIEALRAAVARGREERDAVAVTVDASLRRRYDMILAQRQGLAVVQVVDGNCGGCNLAIPPQLLIEIMKSGAIKVCHSCQRIIYVEPPEPNPAPESTPE